MNSELLPIESPVQKILFGSPGTGKSHKVEKFFLDQLKILADSQDCIKTVFHPEYTYGDFMGKLLPRTIEGNVRYDYYEGDFLKAITQSYKNIIENNGTAVGSKRVVLVIDEINRGNSAAIFGTFFQLLDRNSDGWSSYAIKISRMEFERFTELVFPDLRSQSSDKAKEIVDEMKAISETHKMVEKQKRLSLLLDTFKDINYSVDLKNAIEKFTDVQIQGCFQKQEIKLPPNFSIIGTMNTSDNSIYYMDSAFKRRWDWEFIDVTNDREIANLTKKDPSLFRTLESNGANWVEFVDSLNEFLKFNHGQIRKIEDKQIGYYFIKDDYISDEKIKNKLLFFLWDSVFANSKKPLELLLKMNDEKLITFGQFASKSKDFCEEIIKKTWQNNV